MLAAAWVAAYEVAPYFSDDWGYIHTFSSGAQSGSGIWPAGRWWSWVPFHWLHVNGRAANYLAAIAMGLLPKWAVSAIAGLAVAWMTLMVLRLGGVWRVRGVGVLFCIGVAVVVTVFPWWNYMYSIDVNFNYVLSSAVLLTFVWVLLRHRRLTPWLLWPLGFLAGAMHEAASVPVAAALVWLWCTKPRVRRQAPWSEPWLAGALVSFFAGCLEVVSSPGVWGRLGTSPGGADHPLPVAILLSAPLAVTAAAICVAAGATHRGRGWLRTFFSHPMAQGAAVASVCSLIFCAVSGVTGRSGWFADTFALILLLRMGAACGVRVSPRTAGAAGALAVAMALAASLAPVSGLRHARADIRAIEADLLAAPPGSHRIICRRLYDEHRQPWWCLGRVRALEACDAFTLGQIADYYGAASLAVLPPELAGVDLDTVTASMPLADGSVLTPRFPAMLVRRREGDAWLYLPAVSGAVCYEHPVMCIPVRTPGGRTLWHLITPRYFFGEHPLLHADGCD